MQLFDYIIGVLLIIIAVALIAIIMMQSSKDKGLSGTITGGVTDSYYGKNKSKNKEALYSKITLILAIVFAALVLTLYIFQGSFDGDDASSAVETTEQAESSEEAGDESEYEESDEASEISDSESDQSANSEDSAE